MSYKKYALVPYEMYQTFMKQGKCNISCSSSGNSDPKQDLTKPVSKDEPKWIMGNAVGGPIRQSESKEALFDRESLLARSSTASDAASKAPQTAGESVNVPTNIPRIASESNKISANLIKNKKHPSKSFKQKKAQVLEKVKSKTLRRSKWLKLY